VSDPARSLQNIGTSALPFYGLDIETDTTVNGLDPRVAAVVSIAVVGPGLELVLDGDNESAMLAALDQTLRDTPPGVLVTWNGGGFDLPFLFDRGIATGVSLGLELRADSSIAGHHEPLPGHSSAYRGRWGAHAHLDAYQMYRADVGRALDISCGLKPLARLVGLPLVSVDREQIHSLDPQTRRAYVASDAWLAAEMAKRRPTAMRWVDQFSSLSGS